MKPSFPLPKVITTGIGEGLGTRLQEQDAGLISKPSEITLVVRLQLVLCPDPLAQEPDQIRTLHATRALINHTDSLIKKHTTRVKAKYMTHKASHITISHPNGPPFCQVYGVGYGASSIVTLHQSHCTMSTWCFVQYLPCTHTTSTLCQQLVNFHFHSNFQFRFPVFISITCFSICP